MASDGWGNGGGAGGEGARLALSTARGMKQSLSGASLYSRSFVLLSSILVHAAAARATPISSTTSLRLYHDSSRSRPTRYNDSSSSSSSYNRKPMRFNDRRDKRPTGNWGGNSGATSWGGNQDGGFQSGGGGGYGGQRSTACFNCGEG
jgi:hypothetical protein